MPEAKSFAIYRLDNSGKTNRLENNTGMKKFEEIVKVTAYWVEKKKKDLGLVECMRASNWVNPSIQRASSSFVTK